MTVESPASVETILATFGNENYWQARLADFTDGTAALEELTADDDTVTVALRLGLVRDKLPKVVTQLRNKDLEMVRRERWVRADDGHLRGEVDVTVPGTPLSVTGAALVAPQGSGSRLDYKATITVKVPLVGGKIEDYLRGQTVDELHRIQRFTDAWIAENA